MYVVSEVTGKKYSSWDEAVQDEKKVLEEQARKRQEDADMKAMDKAWDEIISSIEKFISLAEKYEPTLAAEVDNVVQILKTAK